MTDTMDWLEAIGQDATLRHASSDSLVDTLDAADASEALKAAVASGDSAWLAQEFGTPLAMCGSQSSQTFPDEDDVPEEDPPTEPDASLHNG